MLAALYRSPGPAAEVLSVTDVPTPEPRPGQVRVRLRVAGVNPTDWKSRSSTAPEGAFQVPGRDGGGEIEAVGDGVDPARVGERVWVWLAGLANQWGSAAQCTVVPEGQAVRLPDAASYELGASLGVPALTAWHCLFADGPLDGRTVLVAGGAGAVGNAAIALARRGGAQVIATTSSAEKAELARAAGAHQVVDYHDDDAAAQVRAVAPDGVHRFVEVALAANLELDLAAAAPHAVVACYADGDVSALPVRRLMTGNLTLVFVLLYGVTDAGLAAAVAGVGEAVAADALPTLPLIRYPLAEVAAAHDAVQGGAVGKVLLDIP